MRVLRSPIFNQLLALFYAGLALSGDSTVDWLLTQLFDHRTGTLYGFDGKPFDIDGDADLTDDLFGEDQRRFINRYRARATELFQYRLQERLVRPVLMMHFARKIHLCRTLGVCSGR
jgi:hypothetical protein